MEQEQSMSQRKHLSHGYIHYYTKHKRIIQLKSFRKNNKANSKNIRQIKKIKADVKNFKSIMTPRSKIFFSTINSSFPF